MHGDSNNGASVEGEEEEGFVLPVIPPELEVDPLLVSVLHVAAFLDFADDEVVDPEAAGEALEHVGLYIQRLPPEQQEEISQQLDLLVQHGSDNGWPAAFLEFVSEFLYNCGIGDDDETDADDDEVPEED